MTAAEFSRPLKVSEIGAVARPMTIEASEAERAALARRFDLLALGRLAGALSVQREAAGIRLTGSIDAEVTQACALSAEPVEARVAAPVDLIFSAKTEPANADAEVELSESDCDVIGFDGQAVDLGEAVAQTLGLALDPFPQAEDAVVAAARAHLLTEAEITAARSPFASLKKY